uniref:Phospholipase A2-like central domain-containing protein n=1 Tax=Tetradesmus obliquus TaxID=3088 RepID=A0A383VVP4_TETOB|eukprot:jgi/Sobl393_1/19987/SZX68496.1
MAAAAAAAAPIAAAQTAAAAAAPGWDHHQGLQPHHSRLLRQRAQSTVGRMPVYGNWCGPRYGSGTPIDALGACCKRHDDCYDATSYNRHHQHTPAAKEASTSSTAMP